MRNLKMEQIRELKKYKVVLNSKEFGDFTIRNESTSLVFAIIGAKEEFFKDYPGNECHAISAEKVR